MLPPPLRPLTEQFVDEWTRRAHDREFWAIDTAAAFDEITGAAVRLCAQIGVEPDYESAFNIFNIVTMRFACLAHDNPQTQELMGIAGESHWIRPWPRYWARWVDVLLNSLLVTYALAYLAPDVLIWWIGLPRVWYVIVSAFMSLSLVFVEPAIISVIGTTPGKWLLNIQLSDTEGCRLSFNTALERSFEVWWRGMACGLPFVGLLTQVAAKDHLMRTGATMWDRRLGVRVRQQPITVARFVFASVAIVVLLYVCYGR